MRHGDAGLSELHGFVEQRRVGVEEDQRAALPQPDPPEL